MATKSAARVRQGRSSQGGSPQSRSTDEPVRRAAPTSPWWWAAGLVVLAGYATALALATRPVMLVDDAAITFRYAERLATGKGFTYNDHEHVLGASNPLYVLILASCSMAGMDIETAARGLGIALFAGSVVLAALIAAQLASLPGGLLAGVLLASHPFFRTLALCGMESGLAVFLGLLVVLALSLDWQVLAAIVLGLAVWNKLDAGMLAVAVAVAWLLVRRRPPLKIAAIAALVALPWFGFALWYFGSPLPRSMMVKLANNTGLPPDHLWIVREIFTYQQGFVPLLILGATLAAPRVWRTLAPGQRLAAATLGGWFLLHALAFSMLWLGDYYHWYLAVLCPPPIILGCAAGVRLLRPIAAAAWSRRLIAAGAVALLLLAVAPLKQSFAQLGRNSTDNFEIFDFDRCMAGLFLAQYASPSEAVGSKFGWVAYEIANPFNDFSGLNSIKARLPNEYWVMHGQPPFEGFSRPLAPRGYIPLATFNLLSDLVPGSSWFEVFGRPDSMVARSGKRWLAWRLFELPAPDPEPPESGLGPAAITGNDLDANPPSGAIFTVQNAHQPVRVVFMPLVGANDSGGGALFELRVNGQLAWQSRVDAGDRPQIVIAPLRGSELLDRFQLSFITRPGGDGGQPAGRAQWHGVKIMIGDAYVDMARLRGNPLVPRWISYNGAPPSGETGAR